MLKPLVLASHNWKVLLKSLVYQALLLALVVALGYLIFGNLVDDMVKVVRENNVGQLLTANSTKSNFPHVWESLFPTCASPFRRCDCHLAA